MKEQSTSSPEAVVVDVVRKPSRSSRTMWWIEQLITWVSALLLLLYVVSGFGMTKPDLVGQMTGGLITWRVAYDMHNNLHLPLILGFTAHTLLAIRRALGRGTPRARIAGGVSVVVVVAVLAYLLTMSLS